MRRRAAVGLACALALIAACTDDESGGPVSSAEPAATDTSGPARPETTATDPVATDTTTTEPATTEPATTTPATTTPPTTTPPTTTEPPAANPVFESLPPVEEGDPNVRTGVLANGLTYYVRANDNPGDSAELRLVVDAGSGNESAEQSAVAHFLEHMLFNGTTSFPKNELIDILRLGGSQFGSDLNAYTSYDETVYQLKLPTRDSATFETGLDVLAEWLSAATLDPEEVTKERGVVLEEWRARGETRQGRVRLALQELFLGGSGFEGRTPIGERAAIEQMTPEMLRAYYDAAYRPDNAAIVVVGEVDVDTVVAGIEAQFGPLGPRTTEPLAVDPTLDPITEPEGLLITDPDLPDAAVELTLPMVAGPSSLSTLPHDVADGLIFTMIANRLSDDARRGDEPFDRAYVSDNDILRLLDAPSIVVDPKPGETVDAMQLLMDEFERVHRFGFDEAELQRAIAEIRAGVEAAYAARDTRQDADYADTYADAFLSGAPILTEQSTYDLSLFVLDRLTTDFVDARFAHRWDRSAPYVTVYGPAQDESELPSTAEIEDAIAALPDRDLEPRPSGELLDGELMDSPAPVEETSRTVLDAEPDVFLEPVQLEFANGVTVILNESPIVANNVLLSGESNGGLAKLAPEDVIDAHIAAALVTTSGAGEFDQVQLEQLLAGSTAAVQASSEVTSDVIFGSAATSDIQDLFELVHLYMTDPNFDQIALERILDDARATAADPFADQLAAGREALTRARYGDDSLFRQQLTAADIESIDLAGVERAWRSGFGNATGWTFAIVGDIDVDAVTELARQYLGTLVATAPDEAPVVVTPGPPPAVVSETIRAGTGDKATLFRLYSSRVPATVVNAVIADVATEVVSNRILTRLREELGESYSPNAGLYVEPSPDGGDDFVDLYVEIGSSPDQIDDVVSASTAELADLATAGPTDAETEAAMAVVGERYNFINNGQLASVLLAEHRGVGLTAKEFVERYFTLPGLQPDDVREYLASVVPLDRYVEVVAVPR